MKRWIKRIVVLLALGGVGYFVAMSFAPEPIPVETAEALHGPLEVTVDGTGVVRIRDRYVVSAPTSGMLARIDLHPGDSIPAGLPFTTITPLAPPLLDTRTRAEISARTATAEAVHAEAEAAIAAARLAAGQARRER
ncbi:MAG: efflux transporter periplasmic adaptor subunit, partial [Actinomycetota bacterium]